MGNTLYLVSDEHDHAWLQQARQDQGFAEDVVFAPAFKGWLAAQALGLTARTHEDLAWALNKNALFDKARRMAQAWYAHPDVAPALEPIHAYAGYPLLDMHSSLLLLSFYEILQAVEFIAAVVDREQPRRIVAGARPNPFHRDMLHIVANSGGLEREAARAVASARGIEFIAMPTGQEDAEAPILLPAEGDPSFRPAWKQGAGPGILVVAWPGYYLQQLERTFPALLDRGVRLALAVVGDILPEADRQRFEAWGMLVFQKNLVAVPDMTALHREWLERSRQAMEQLPGLAALHDFFRHQGIPWFAGLAQQAIGREYARNLAGTVVELRRTECVLDMLQPDMVFAQFAMHPGETCDVLPARKRGIPTLCMCHGVNGDYYAERHTFATEYYATPGQSFKTSLATRFPAHANKIVPVGESRLETLRPHKDIRDAKRQAGFSPDAPLLIVCDNSGWTHTQPWRHTTRTVALEVTRLKALMPELQIVFRVHHGLECAHLQRFFASHNDPGLQFQLSPTPLLTDMLQAADLVVSHVTSAITESLLMGVPVIYLRALCEQEPIYEGVDSIHIADSFEDLPGLIQATLARKYTREAVLAMSRPFFDRMLHGNDGQATQRQADLMHSLAQLPAAARMFGFDDWIDRLRASAAYRSTAPHSAG